MNIGFWSRIILAILFVIIGVLFAIFKEKAAKFVSGFNSFSKEEQALYCLLYTSHFIVFLISLFGQWHFLFQMPYVQPMMQLLQ